MTSVVSRIGTARISTGSATVAIVVPASLYDAISPSDASTNPISWLPESPMKTRAGPLRPEVVRDEAEQGERERRRDDEDVAVR